jgi:hypothetical protein
LEVNADDFGGVFVVNKIWPHGWLAGVEVFGDDNLWLTGDIRGLGGWGQCGGQCVLPSNGMWSVPSGGPLMGLVLAEPGYMKYMRIRTFHDRIQTFHDNENSKQE